MKLVQCGWIVGAMLMLSYGAVAQTQDAAREGAPQTQVFHNSSSINQDHSVSIAQRFTFDQFDPHHLIAHNNLYEFNTPGYNWGNAGGWSVQIGTSSTGTFNTRGIGQMSVSNAVKHATGDFAAQYTYAFTDGGVTAQSDEGFALDTRQGGETDKWFHGTAAEGATAGTTLLPVTYVAGSQSQQTTTDGAYMLDISKGKISGIVTGEETLVKGTSVHVIPVSATLPVSTGIGVVNTPIPRIKVENTPETITLTGVHLIRGSFVTGKACLAGGWYPEQVLITKTETAANGVQDVTIVHKNPNGTDANNPTSLWQGGLCGQYLSLDRNIARDGFPTSYEVVGATDSSHLAYIWNVKGFTKQNVLRVYEPPVKLRNLSRKNGVVTASFSQANEPYIFNHAASVVIAGASDPSLNGTVHQPAYDDDLNRDLHWSQPGPDTTSQSATIDLPSSYYGFHLYPGAEVLGPEVAGRVPLEPNSVDWAPGDMIENPHNPSFEMGAKMTSVYQHTLPNGTNSGGQLWAFMGAGISANYYPSTWRNLNPCPLYIGCGGTLEPIQWSVYEGPYRDLIYARSAPLNAGSLITVGCDLRGCNHQAPYQIFQLQNGEMDYDPSDGNFTVPQMSASLFTGHLNGPLTTTQIDLQDPRSPGQVLTITNSHGQVVINSHAVAGAQSTGSSNALTVGRPTGGATSSASQTLATVLPGAASRGISAACAKGYVCTSDRGRIILAAAASASAGTIASVRTSLPAGTICIATQNGGSTFLGIGSGDESAQGFDITAGVVWRGVVTIDYSCR
ncbi:hypothetical protein [Edaphobacter dinghuensis]|uniref:Uncharacterized protein n=1 Tax=Edaphobacter dinghuensis TaxID=1560005 RepID=A0A917HAS1_9BACT|nr:hypothetical protein [Edaphobacter dinghuensis]GGG72494.1 hypothetical protein GCM10011585_13600 [Edaphobacter dinghuensis]